MTAPAGLGSAFCQHAHVSIPGAASGPLAGYSFAAKDVFAIAGVRACYGNPRWLETHQPAQQTAPLIQQLLAAGASLIGLTLTDELALSLSGENVHYGTPDNPRAPGRIPGGSSCGSASAVAAAQVDFALGTDTGGSVRVPASYNGIYGLRPSHGAIDARGVLPLAPSLDTAGLFARDPQLLERVGQVVLPEHGPSELPSRLYLLAAAESFMDPGAWAEFLPDAERVARRLGRKLEPVPDVFSNGPSEWFLIYVTIQGAELAHHHRAYLEREKPEHGSLIARRIEWALAGGPLPLADAAAQQAKLQGELTQALEDAWLILPSAQGPAPLRGLDDDATEAFTSRALSLTALASVTGSPQLSMPLATVEGLPLGVSLLGPRGSDRALLAAASSCG